VASSGARGKTRKGITMRQEYHGRGTHHSWVGIIGLMAVLLVASVGPGHARGGAHGFGGHHGFRGRPGRRTRRRRGVRDRWLSS